MSVPISLGTSMVEAEATEASMVEAEATEVMEPL